jgi:hypothetical protein
MFQGLRASRSPLATICRACGAGYDHLPRVQRSNDHLPRLRRCYDHLPRLRRCYDHVPDQDTHVPDQD